MSYTTESIEVPRMPVNTIEQNQFNLPVKEFLAYDPKGTMSVTGTPIARPSPDVNATQPNTIEKNDPEPVAAPEESVKLSPQISALARKEAAQRQREQAFRAREKALEEKLAKADQFEKLQAKIASKDYSAADELGLTYEEYTKYLLDKQSGEKPEEQRYRKVEEELSALKKAQEEQTQREYQANQNLWKQEIKKAIEENEAYSTIKELSAEGMVLQHINDSFEEDGTELTVEQAAKDIEDALIERAEKFASVTKIKNKLEAQTKVLGPPKAQPKTITQNMTVTSQKPASKPFHLMSESEQLAEAYRRVQAAKIQR